MIEVDENGFVAHRWLPDGRLLAVTPMTYSKFRLTTPTSADRPEGDSGDSGDGSIDQAVLAG